MNVVTKIYDSFGNDSAGFSAKKLTAFAIVAVYCYSHRFVDSNNLMGVLGVDAGLITLLFGVNVIDKYKNPVEPQPSFHQETKTETIINTNEETS
jgi:hypothetical protein